MSVQDRRRRRNRAIGRVGAIGYRRPGAAFAAPRPSPNRSIHDDHQAAPASMPFYAEWGGFMYLYQGIIDLERQFYTLAGLIPGKTHMQPRLMSLGYRLVESPGGNFLLPQGASARGHEFHWSTWDSSTVAPAWHIRPRQGEKEGKPSGYAKDNLIGSYVHLHFASNPHLAYNFAQACRTWLGSL